MLIGYARALTDNENLDLLHNALRLAGCAKVYEDRVSGAKAARPSLALALEPDPARELKEQMLGAGQPV